MLSGIGGEARRYDVEIKIATLGGERKRMRRMRKLPLSPRNSSKGILR